MAPVTIMLVEPPRPSVSESVNARDKESGGRRLHGLAPARVMVRMVPAVAAAQHPQAAGTIVRASVVLDAAKVSSPGKRHRAGCDIQ